MFNNVFKYIIIVLLAVYTQLSIAQSRFEMTPDIEEAYQLAMSLRKIEALDKITALKVSDPDNMLILHIENYIDFFDIFIKEDEQLFDKLESNKDRRLSLLNQKVDSPYQRFVKAEILLQWALARLKFDQEFKAATEVYTAYKLLQENIKLYPDFALNKKSMSILHAVAESIPGIVRKVFGVKGSIELGTQEIQSLTFLGRSEVSIFYDEITTIYAYILLFQNNKKSAAWKMINDRNLDHTTNPLAAFVKANMAQKNGYNDLAIDILNERPKGPQFESFYYLDLLIGKAKLYRLESGADKDIKRFIDNFNGEHFIKEAYQKLAWYELVMNNDFIAYKKYMQLCLDNGANLVDEDDQAQKEAKSKEIPNPDLLIARLLYDGGYYQRAHTHLITKSYLFHTGNADYLEYNYRLGRITQALSNPTDAIQYYGYVINLGSKAKSYFACNAALQIGLIFEGQKKYKKALYYLEKCLDIDPDEYKRSLHQKAESAIERVNEKSKKP